MADSNYEQVDILEPEAATETEAPRKGLPLVRNIPPKARGWLLGGVALVVAAAGGWALFGPKGATTELVTAPVTRGNIEDSVLATGVLEPSKLVSVGAQASGQVKKLYVELGDVVKAGDPIAEIDARTQTNNMANAQAGLSNVTAQRAAASAALTEAEQSYARAKRLFEAGAGSQADFQSAEASLANARASLRSSDASIRQASLSLNTAETNLGYTKIVAPMDGTIVAIVTEEGQTVNANQSAPTIVMLAQLDKMTVSAEISEADVDKVTEGQKVYFTTLGDTRTRHYAELRAVAPAPESIESQSSSTSSSSSASAVYYNGLFDVDNPDGKLRTGMTAQVYIVQDSAENALVIPSSAIQGRARGGNATVKVVGESGKPQERQVKIGINTNVQAQVIEGLQEGERVVVAQAAPQQNAGRQNSQGNPLVPSGRGMRGGGRGPGGGG